MKGEERVFRQHGINFMLDMFFQYGSSDKQYRAWIEYDAYQEDLFNVGFAYGPRQTNMNRELANTGLKNKSPLTLAKAKKELLNLIMRKFRKGYTTHISYRPYEHVDNPILLNFLAALSETDVAEEKDFVFSTGKQLLEHISMLERLMGTQPSIKLEFTRPVEAPLSALFYKQKDTIIHHASVKDTGSKFLSGQIDYHRVNQIVVSDRLAQRVKAVQVI